MKHNSGCPKSLLKISECEVTSYEILARAYRRRGLSEVLPIRKYYELWRHMGSACCAVLQQGKGIRIAGFLEITFDQRGKLMYILEKDKNRSLQVFGSGHSMQWKADRKFLGASDNPVLAALPYASVLAALTTKSASRTSSKKYPALTRGSIEHVCTTIFSEFILTARGKCESLFLALHQVGDIIYKANKDHGVISIQFHKDFVQGFIASEATLAIRHPRHRFNVATWDERPRLRKNLQSNINGTQRLLPAPGTVDYSCRKDKCLVCKARTTMNTIKDAVKQRNGVFGLHLLYKALQSIHEELDVDELRWALRDQGIELDDAESINLVALFDRDGGGTLSITEFMDGFTTKPISKERIHIIRRLFSGLQRSLDLPDGSSLILNQRLRKLFNPWADPRVQAGHPQYSAREFTDIFFNALDDTGDGEISYGEFFKMYAHCSATIEDDNDFKKNCLSLWQGFMKLPHSSQKLLHQSSPESNEEQEDYDSENLNNAVLSQSDGTTLDDNLLDAILDSQDSGPLTKSQQIHAEMHASDRITLGPAISAKKVAHRYKANLQQQERSSQQRHTALW